MADDLWLRPTSAPLLLPHKLLGYALHFFYPTNCSTCGEQAVETLRSGRSCAACWAMVDLFDAVKSCLKCGRSQPAGTHASAKGCIDCSDRLFDRAAAAAAYNGAVKNAILDLKRTPHLPKVLRSLIAQQSKIGFGGEVDVVIPVPLSAKRHAERGFNQADLIASVVGKTLDIRPDRFSLKRLKHVAASRTGMDRKARERSVEGAFAVTRPALISGKRVLLVDDVLTSGATASACAKELKANGAVSVGLFTIARA